MNLGDQVEQFLRGPDSRFFAEIGQIAIRIFSESVSGIFTFFRGFEILFIHSRFV